MCLHYMTRKLEVLKMEFRLLSADWDGEITWIFPLGPEDRMMPGTCEIQGKASLPASAGTL